MSRALAVLAPLFMNAAPSVGHDEFGRQCALTLNPTPAVMIEDEWYRHPRHARFDRRRGSRTGRYGATVFAADGTPGELDLALVDGHGVSFTLTLESATGYVHACTLTTIPPKAADGP